MVYTHLNDTKTYREVPCFPVNSIRDLMTSLFDKSRIPEWKRTKWTRFATDNASAAAFYAMPKIHKPSLFVTRPIAAQHSYILAPLSKALATELLEVPINVLMENIPLLKENYSFWGKVLKLVMFYSFVSFNDKVYQSILFQRRFVDDGFIVIKSREDALRLQSLMKENSAFKFTFDISEQEAVFLDFHIYKGIRFEHANKLDFRPYFKPTNKFLYLPHKSSGKYDGKTDNTI